MNVEVGDLPRPPFLERISARQWVAVDVVLAGLFFIGSTVALYLSPHSGHPVVVSRWLLWPLVASTTIPIAFRRRWPEVALICVAVSLTVTTMLGQSLATEPLLALPLYSVILKYSRRQSLMVLVAVEVLSLLAFIVAAVLRPVHGDISFIVILAGATWFVGDSVRTRRAYQAGLVKQERDRKSVV